MSRPLTLDDLAAVNGQPVGACLPPPPAQPTPPPPVDLGGQPSCAPGYIAAPFCDRLLRMEPCLIAIGKTVRGGKNIDPARIATEMQTLMDTKPAVTGAGTVRSNLLLVISAMLESEWHYAGADVWAQSLEALVPADQVDIVLNLVAARQFLRALSEFAVHWAHHHQVGTGVGGSLAGGLSR